MAAGSQQTLSFDTGDGANTAVHGGGSCQISITYETDAAKVKDPKNWYVIYSIEGGCPSNTLANLDGTYTGPAGSYTGAYQCNDTAKTNGVDCVNQFEFEIPKGVKEGHAILAWTWFNNVGNREMYMNCVNAQLTGGDGSEMESFPSMFVANMAGVDQCPTIAYQAVAFPDPGKYLTTKVPPSSVSQSTTYPLVTPTGAGCAGDGGSGSAAGSGSPSAAGETSAVATSVPVYTSAVASESAAASSAGSDITITTMATVTGSYSTAAATESTVAAAAPSDSSSSAGSGTTSNTGSNTASSASSGSCASGNISCVTDGAVVCIGSTQWGLCNAGCAVPMALAAGTSCSDGAISKKRAVRVSRRRQYVARRRVF